MMDKDIGIPKNEILQDKRILNIMFVSNIYGR